MQFTSNIIIALLLAVSNSSTVTATQKSVNLRGGGSNLQEKPFSDPSPSELSSIMNDAANPPLPNLERSLADAQFDGCPGLDLPKPNTGEGAPGCVELSCPGKTKCYSWIHEDCYCN